MSAAGWDTDFATGLLDDFEFTIQRAYFAPDAKYNNGETTLLQWEGTTNDVDQPETHIWWPLGNNWYSPDTGKSIEHQKGSKYRGTGEGKFVKSSLMAKLIERCVTDLGLGALLESRGNVTEAKVWEGLKFKLLREEIVFGPGISPKNALMPTAFLGVQGEAAPAAAPVPPAPPAAAPAAAPPIDPAVQAQIDAARAGQAAPAADANPLAAQVQEVFRAAASHQDAMQAALQIPGVLTDNDLMAAIVDENALWKQLRG